MYKSGHEAPLQQTTIKCTIKRRKTTKVSFQVIYTRRHEQKGYVMIGFLSWPLYIRFVMIPGRFETSRLLARCKPHSLADKELANTKGELGPLDNAFEGIKTHISNECNVEAPKHSKTPFFSLYCRSHQRQFLIV